MSLALRTLPWDITALNSPLPGPGWRPTFPSSLPRAKAKPDPLGPSHTKPTLPPRSTDRGISRPWRLTPLNELPPPTPTPAMARGNKEKTPRLPSRTGAAEATPTDRPETLEPTLLFPHHKIPTPDRRITRQRLKTQTTIWTTSFPHPDRGDKPTAPRSPSNNASPPPPWQTGWGRPTLTGRIRLKPPLYSTHATRRPQPPYRVVHLTTLISKRKDVGDAGAAALPPLPPPTPFPFWPPSPPSLSVPAPRTRTPAISETSFL